VYHGQKLDPNINITIFQKQNQGEYWIWATNVKWDMRFTNIGTTKLYVSVILLFKMAIAVQEQQYQTGQGDVSDTTTHGGLRSLPEVLCKHIIDDWKDSAALYVRQKLFDKKQFVTDDELVMGGNIQKLVCEYINVSGEVRAILFWEERGGMETIRNMVQRKWQAA
jgi:hypothetical protein